MNYTPDPENSIAKIAEREGRNPLEVAYDLLLQKDGKAILMHAVAGYAFGNPNDVIEMIRHPLSVLGLSDAGAHCSQVCDGGIHTYVLTNWSRDRDSSDPLHLPLEWLVKKLTADNAKLYGMNDRGIIEPGKRADINIIDLDSLKIGDPKMVFDLPAEQPVSYTHLTLPTKA